MAKHTLPWPPLGPIGVNLHLVDPIAPKRPAWSRFSPVQQVALAQQSEDVTHALMLKTIQQRDMQASPQWWSWAPHKVEYV